MNLFVKHDEFNINYLHFLNQKKNLIMDGNFTKIMYSNQILSMNGLFIVFDFDNLICPLHIENSQSNDMWNNISLSILETIKDIEYKILNYYKDMFYSNKKILYSNNLQYGTRSYKPNESKLLFKISGIWETEFEIGITYKILYSYS
jgi:hypothetical protein